MATSAQRVDSHTRLRKNRERQLRRAAQSILLSERNWYGPAQVLAMSNRVGALVDNAATDEARLTQAYLTGLYNDAGVTPNSPRTPVIGSRRMGTTAAEAYQRVPAVYRSHIAAGLSHEESLDRAMNRLGNMIATDLQLAHREAARRTFGVNGRRTSGFRRIIRPELTGGNVCGLCIVAADRVYSISDLMPLHNGCHCDVAPIVGDFDPGISLNREDLDALYHAAGGDETSAEALRQVKVAIHEHGEIGPTMTPEGEDSSDIREAYSRAKPGNRSYEARPNFDALIASSERTVDRLEREIAEGLGDASTSAALDFQYGHLASLLERRAASD